MPKKKPWNISFQGFDDRYTRQLRHALVVFFHPDFNRWLWISTRSALLLQGSRALLTAVASFRITASEEFRLALKTVFNVVYASYYSAR